MKKEDIKKLEISKMQFLFCIRIRILMRFWDSVKSRDVTKGMRHCVCH